MSFLNISSRTLRLILKCTISTGSSVKILIMSEITFKIIAGLAYGVVIALMWLSYMNKRKRAKIVSVLKSIYDVAQNNPLLVSEYAPEMEVLLYLIRYYLKKDTISPEKAYEMCWMLRTPHNIRKAECLKHWINTGKFSFYTSE